MTIELSESFKTAENSLRDFIALHLQGKYGNEWINHTGIESKKIKKWESSLISEPKKLHGEITETRLVYYSDFNDLVTIIEKNWHEDFKEVFPDQEIVVVFLKTLKSLRNSDSHRRELLTHQQHLVLGISGYLRSQIVRYRSKMETPEDIFPRIESIRDNYGSIWVPGENKSVETGLILRVGDYLEFIVTATDPNGGTLYYGLHPSYNWQTSNIIQIPITVNHIQRNQYFLVSIKNNQPYRANGNLDDCVSFSYQILP